jgi:hypothetical protein
MRLVNDWRERYIQADAYTSHNSKSDLIYLIHKFGRETGGGEPPSRVWLRRKTKKQLRGIWESIKPFQFGLPPWEVAA